MANDPDDEQLTRTAFALESAAEDIERGKMPHPALLFRAAGALRRVACELEEGQRVSGIGGLLMTRKGR